MEVSEAGGEVSYTVKIPNFSTYMELDQKFMDEFPVKINHFSSCWRLSLSPFTKARDSDGEDPVNWDIAVSLTCLSCNVNKPNIEVYTHVHGKDQHEKSLPQSRDKELTWQGLLVTRLGLKIFKLLYEDQLTATLRFVVNGCDMERAVGGVESLSQDMRMLLTESSYSDADIVTTDGVKIPMHLSVLAHRSSNFLTHISFNKKQSVHSPSPPKILKADTDENYPALPETPINSTFGSISSGYLSSNSRPSTPESMLNYNQGTPPRVSKPCSSKDTTPRMRTRLGSPIGTSQVLFKARKATPRRISQLATVSSPIKSPLYSNRDSIATDCGCPKTQTFKKKSISPVKNPIPKNSLTPKRNTPTRISYSPTVSSRKSFVPSPKKSMIVNRLSQTKSPLHARRRSVGINRPSLKTPSPSKRLTTPVRLSFHPLSHHKPGTPRTPKIDTPSPKRRLYDMDQQFVKDSGNDFKPIDIDIPVCTTRPMTLERISSPNHLRSLDKVSMEGLITTKGHRPKIRVNMSASVTLALLEWIYTGECSELDRMPRALLVASLRYGVTGLTRACESYLAATLTPDNTAVLLFLAAKYTANHLRESALKYAVKEAASVTSKPQWPILAQKYPGLVAEFSRRLANHQVDSG